MFDLFYYPTVYCEIYFTGFTVDIVVFVGRYPIYDEKRCVYSNYFNSILETMESQSVPNTHTLTYTQA